MLFFADRGERAVTQGLLIGAVTSIVVMMLLLLSSLDNPFHPGVGGLRPVAMERTSCGSPTRQLRVIHADVRSPV